MLMIQANFVQQDSALPVAQLAPEAKAHPAAQSRYRSTPKLPRQPRLRIANGASFSCAAPNTTCPNDAPRRPRDVPQHTPVNPSFPALSQFSGQGTCTTTTRLALCYLCAGYTNWEAGLGIERHRNISPSVIAAAEDSADYCPYHVRSRWQSVLNFPHSFVTRICALGGRFCRSEPRSRCQRTNKRADHPRSHYK